MRTTAHYRVCYDDVTMSDVGKRLGRYVLEQPLGRGGMAEAWLARQEGPAGFEKRVVLKRILPAHDADATFIEMFLREARVAARLNHPNIVQVFELDQVDGAWIIVMEHLDGLTLRRAAKKCWSMGDDFPMEVVLRAAMDTARGLAEAHDKGLVHRDVSPDNLMLTRAGVTKVLDFGIAKLTTTEPGDHVTRTGEIKGKLPFMSPEQVRGENIDGRTDLWALGVTMYWLLTGRRPFLGDNDAQILNAILNETPPTPRSLNALIPSRVDKLVLGLLEKKRDARLANGTALANAIVDILGPVAAGPEPAQLVEKLLGAPEPAPNAPGAPERTQVASRPQTSWLMRSENASPGATEVLERSAHENGDVVDNGSEDGNEHRSRSTIITDVAPPPRRGIYVGIASAALLAAIGVVALNVGDHDPVVTVTPTLDAGATRVEKVDVPVVDVARVAPREAVVDAGASESDVGTNVKPIAVKQPRLPKQPKEIVESPTPPKDPVVDTPPKVPTSSTTPTSAFGGLSDEALVESCKKPCASLWRTARDENKGTPESRKRMAASCASICRGK